MTHHASRITKYLPLLAIGLLALGLRLLAWRWHEPYQLGGDESEYFNQALILLREHRYVELNLMRPPLYTGFLVACIALFDSLVQRLRLVQALISALTVLPVYLLTWQLFGHRRVALLAALLTALSYTLAAHATELLTETLFVFGLTTLFCLLLAAGRRDGRTGDQETGRPGDTSEAFQPLLFALLAGLNLGALALLRSVALPLLPLGALWLLVRRRPTTDNRRAAGRLRSTSGLRTALGSWQLALAFVLGAGVVITPWTARNYATYGTIILIDTTGAENLWLDNNPAASTGADPLGREDAKRQLYALGDDRAARQRLASANGLAAISTHPAWFAAKAWGEAKKFFALEYFDDLHDRRAIWVAPLEVWLRLVFGDGLWLLLLLAGACGLVQGSGVRSQGVREPENRRTGEPGTQHSALSTPRWLFVPWALYTLLTAVIFHVELRYRLPLFPVLLPYAAVCIVHCRLQIADWFRQHRTSGTLFNRPSARRVLRGSSSIQTLLCLAFIAITLLHRPYGSISWRLAQKHYQLWQAERALDRSDAPNAQADAQRALALDDESVLARVALARVALARGDQALALAQLDVATRALAAHPQAHLLRGAILRQNGDLTEARRELAYEDNSLQDLQRWSWDAFAPFAPLTALNVGSELDLGFVRGFWLTEKAGFRWSKDSAELRLAAPPANGAHLAVTLNGARPAGAAPAQVTVLINGRELGRLTPGAGWQTYRFALHDDLAAGPALLVQIRSTTFRPRDIDRANPDNRQLGVMVRSAAVE